MHNMQHSILCWYFMQNLPKKHTYFLGDVTYFVSLYSFLKDYDLLLLQVQYSDAQSGKDFVTYLTLSPVQMTFHGTGSTLQASHDQVCVQNW